MSYILDALKRADAERGRGAVPGLHARQLTATATRATSSSQSRLWLILAAMLALGAGAAGLWFWRSPAIDTRPTALEPALPSPVASPPVAAPTVAPKPVVQTPGVAAQVPAKGKPDPVAKAVKRQASAPTAPASQAIAKASAAPVAAPTVPLLSELPEDIRRQVPALTITGAVYSETPGQRLLLVNNQVLAQGSVITPELILEEIRAKSSIFNFRGTRFRLAH